MNSLAIDIISEYNEVTNIFAEVADEFENLRQVESLMQELDAAVENVKTFGLDEESFHLFASTLRDDATKNLPVLVEHAEEIAQKKKEGLLKKFWEGIKSIVRKICEFFGKLFNTTTSKCNAILHAKVFDFKKPVFTLARQEFVRIGQCTALLVTYCDQHGISMNMKISNAVSESLPADMVNMARAYPSILELDEEGFRLKIREEAYYLANQSLELAGYQIGDIVSLTRAYLARTTKISAISEKWRKALNKTLEQATLSVGESRGATDLQINAAKALFRLNTTAYTALAKLERASGKQINAFYECVAVEGKENLEGGVREQDPDRKEENKDDLDNAEPSTESFKETWEAVKNKVGIMFDSHAAMRKFMEDSMQKFSDLRGTYYVRTVMPADLKKALNALSTLTDVLNETRKGKAVDLAEYKDSLAQAGIDLKEDGKLYDDRFKVGNWGAGTGKSKLSSPMTFRKTIDEFGWKSAAASCASEFIDNVKTADKKQIASAIDNHAKDLMRAVATKAEKTEIMIDKKVALNQIKNVLNVRNTLIKFSFQTLRRVLSAYTQSGDTSGF